MIDREGRARELSTSTDLFDLSANCEPIDQPRKHCSSLLVLRQTDCFHASSFVHGLGLGTDQQPRISSVCGDI